MASVWTLRASGGASAIDLAEVRRALEVLADPQHYLELRGLPSGRSRVRKGDDLDGLAQAACDLANDSSLYWCMNPVGAIGDRGAKKDDVLSRRWLLVDADPVRPDPDTSATDAEKEQGRRLAVRVNDHLSQEGWPPPLLVDSGNGWHLLYRIDMPNTQHSHALLRAVLYGLAARFDTDAAKIDRKVHNAARVSKLPGCWARKGKPTADRPHRPCRLVHVPDEIYPVPVELIQKAAGPIVEKAGTAPRAAMPSTNGSPWKLWAGSNMHAYAAAALGGEVMRIKLAKPGPEEGRNNALNTAAFNMGQCVGAGWIFRQEVESKLSFAALGAGLGEQEVRNTLRSGIEAGMAQPREAPASREEKSAADAVPAGELIIVRANEIKLRDIEWVWPGRIPLGKLTTFAGQGGLGKTFVLCDIAARISLGADWPDTNGECAEQGQILFISGEDELDDTIVPRLLEVGADLSRIVFLKTEVQDRFMLSDIKILDRAVEQAGVNVRFVAIDPPTAYLGGVDDHKNAELRALLSPLKTWAAKHRVALVFNTHVNKPQGVKVEAMMRVMGSVAWINAVRAAHMFAKDPEDHNRRLFVGMKLNIGKERKGLAYRIVDSNRLARVEWLGEVDTTADEAVNREKKKRRVIASEWLEELFEGKHELSSRVIWDAKKQTTLSDDALKEAKEDMGIKARRTTGPDGEQCWVWIWPPDARKCWQESSQEGDSMAF